MQNQLQQTLLNNQHAYHKVVPFDAADDKLLRLNFTNTNTILTAVILNDTSIFSDYINELLGDEYKYGVGGYDEHRTVYARSEVFDDPDEPRRLHLGVDVWGAAGTPVFAPLDGTVHSFAFNGQYGDYGATIILKHDLDGVPFHTLYGHLSLQDLVGLEAGKKIYKGDVVAHFGEPAENGQWPPHLHFQLIEDIGEWKGDYPGVCKFSEKEKYLQNCPDPDLILQMMQYAVV